MDSYHLQLALFYATYYVKVFPCREVPGDKPDKSGKIPQVKAPYIEGGFHNATNNEAEIRQLWAKYPNALVGIPCKSNGIVVLDADRHKDGANGVSALHGLFKANVIDTSSFPLVITPTNNGEHYIFKESMPNLKARGKLFDGVEIKSNGYIIAAGSILPPSDEYPQGGQYTLKNISMEQFALSFVGGTLPYLPDELYPLVYKDYQTTVSQNSYPNFFNADVQSSTSSQNNDGLTAYIAAAIRGEAEKLASTGKGNRNNQVNSSAYSLGTLAEYNGLDMEYAKQTLWEGCKQNGLSYEEFEGAFNSGFNAGLKTPRESVIERDRQMIAAVDFIGVQQKQTPTVLTSSANPLVMHRVADVEAEAVKWFWPSFVPLRKYSIISGDPGLGKSQLTMYMAAKASTGGVWPKGNGYAPKGSVIILSCEDDIADTIRPRLEALGADLSKIYVIEAARDKDGKLRGFSIEEDIPKLQALLETIDDVVAVIIDPISSYMGKKVDGYKPTDVRVALAPLQLLAHKYNTAIIAISHFNKAGGNGKSTNATTGSGAFVQAARSSLIVVKDPNDDEKRLLLTSKANLAKKNGIAFTVNIKHLPSGIEAPYLEFSDEEVTITADEALQQANTSTKTPAMREAEEFLHENLQYGPLPANELFKRAKDEGISVATLRRAKKSMGLVVDKDGYQGPSLWKYPFHNVASGELSNEHQTMVPQSSKGDQPQSVSTFDVDWSSLPADEKESVS